MKANRKIRACLAVFAGTVLLLAGCADKGDGPERDSVRQPLSSGEEEKADQIAGEIREPENEPFTMLFTGDIQLGSNITSAYDSGGLERILSPSLLEELQGADITMVNEEFPFGTGGTQAPDKQFTFKTDPSYVKIFNEMGVDIVSLANNHVLDFGQDVLSQTFDTLDQAGIAYVGAGDSLERAGAWQDNRSRGQESGVFVRFQSHTGCRMGCAQQPARSIYYIRSGSSRGTDSKGGSGKRSGSGICALGN